MWLLVANVVFLATVVIYERFPVSSGRADRVAVPASTVAALAGAAWYGTVGGFALCLAVAAAATVAGIVFRPVVELVVDGFRARQRNR